MIATDNALANFLALLTDMVAKDYAKNASCLVPPRFSLEPGMKYIRVVKTHQEKIRDGSGSIGDGQRMVYCFIQKDNGDILKANGWKKPAKHARGNIHNANPLEGCAVHGVRYLVGGFNCA